MTRPLPFVSCLMATHGRHSLVSRALGMFLAQDYPARARELVILNNHPEPLEFEHPQVRIFNEPGHPTLGHCRQRLLKLAAGDLVRTWDDDDWYLPNSISQGVAHLGDAAAFKPARSWFTNGGRSFQLVGNAMEATIIARKEIVERYGYQQSGGDEHAPLLAGLHKEGLATRELGPWTGYCYTWGCGATHISGSIGSGLPLAQRTAEWMQRNQDVKPGIPLQPPANFHLWNLWITISDWIEPNDLRAEWQKRMIGDTSKGEDLDKSSVCRVLASRIADKLRRKIVVCEFGRLREPTEEARRGDGWSTLQFVTSDRVAHLLSIDPRPETIDVCRQVIPPEAMSRVVFADHWPNDPALPIDLLLLDADDCPMQQLDLLRQALPMLQPHATIAVDDFRFRMKWPLVRAFLEPTHRAEVNGDLLVFHRRELPDAMSWPPRIR